MRNIILSLVFLIFLLSCQKSITLTRNESSTIFSSVPLTINPQEQNQTILQILLIKNYAVEAQLFTYIPTGNFPTITNKITLDGIPYATTSQVEHTELYFYSDSRSNQKAYYDSSKKTIYAFYPILNYDRIYNMLRQNQNNILLQFYENPNFQSKEVTFRIYGTIPVQP